MMELSEVFESLKTKKALIIGDVMIDAYVFGSKHVIDTLSSPILNATRKVKKLGGAANVALNIQSLGATPILCSVVGDDRDGEIFERLLQEQGMPNKGIIRSQNRMTTNKLRVLSGAQQLIRIDSEDVHPLIELDRKALLNHIKDLVGESDVIIFADYEKGTIYSEIISETIELANRNEIPVVADPRKQNFSSYQGVSLLKPGILELQQVLARKIDERDEHHLREAISKVHEGIGAAAYLITLDDGSIYYQDQKTSYKIPPYNAGASDMSGVGNAVISIVGLALAAGLDGDRLAILASRVAGIVANYSGVVPIDKDQLLKALTKGD